MECAEYRDLVASHADGRLEGSELAAADRHAEVCRACAAARSASAAARQILRDRVGLRRVAPGLRTRIEAATVAKPVALGRTRTRWVVQGAVAAAAVFALVSLVQQPESPLGMVVADVNALSNRMPSLSHAVSPPSLAATEVLGSRGWRLLGAREGTWGTMQGTMSVYQAADGKRLAVHQMRVGPGFRMPEGGVRVGDRVQYWIDGVVLSLALRGDVVSCLASRMSRDEFASRVTG